MEKKYFLIGLLVAALGLAGAILPVLAQDTTTDDQTQQQQQQQQNGTDTPQGAPQTGHGWASQ